MRPPSHARLLIGVTALLAMIAGCDLLGEELGTRHIDLPLGAAGAFQASDSTTVSAGTVRLDSVELPERAYFAEEMNMDTDHVELRSSPDGASPQGSGTVQCGMLIDGYPVAVWTVSVDDGAVDGVEPSTTPIPGKQKEEQAHGVVRMPGEHWTAFSNFYEDLPEDRRPELADPLGFTFPDGEVEEGDWRDIFRGVNQNIERREFRLTLISNADESIQGTLALKVVNITVFDSGQRLMGGTETAE
jgi:hypothetical protein